MITPCALMVSVIVPVYNIHNYIARCIKSICRQSLKEIEIILINDGSTDDSLTIINKLKKQDERIQVICQKNQGLSAARNIGIEKALGKYILFVDGDDYLEDSHTLELLVEIAENNEIEIVLFPYKKIYLNNSQKTLLPIKSDGMIRDVKSEVLRKLIGPTAKEMSELEKVERLNTAWGKLYRRDCIGKVRFVDTKQVGVEDGLFNIEIFSKINRAWYDKDIYYCYEKENNASLLHRYDFNYYQARKKAYRRIHSFLVKSNLNDWVIFLENHRVAEIPGILSKMCQSNLSLHEKIEEAKKILNDEDYRNALNKLDIDAIQGVWKYFYLLCRRRKVFTLICLGEVYIWMKR